VSTETSTGTRLITHNLVLSAGAALSGKQEFLSDLYLLIDLFCLAPRAVVLGRDRTIETGHTDLTDLLRQYNFVSSVPSPGSCELTVSARTQLLTYLKTGKADPLLDEVFTWAAKYCNYPVQHIADGGDEFRRGQTLLQTFTGADGVIRILPDPSGSNEHREVIFFVRSFLYLAMAEESQLVFVPDSTRASLVASLLESNRRLRERLREALHQGYQERLGVGLNRDVGPLAAVVFERSGGDPYRIVSEMAKLRDELAPMRKRLTEAECRIFSGTGDDVAEEVNKWEGIVKEIRQSFGLEPSLVTLEKLLGSAPESVGASAAERPGVSWTQLLLNLSVEPIRRMLARGPVVELHRLRRELPGADRLGKAVRNLFG